MERRTFMQDLKRMGRELWDEGVRLTIQGRAEVAQALFSESNSYVPYGRGQSNEKDVDHQKEQEREGR